jgi:hypothetical protein
MNLTQLEWIASDLKRKSYECFKPYCNSRGLNLRDCHCILPLHLTFFSLWPWGRSRGCAGEELDRRCGPGRAPQA